MRLRLRAALLNAEIFTTGKVSYLMALFLWVSLPVWTYGASLDRCLEGVWFALVCIFRRQESNCFRPSIHAQVMESDGHYLELLRFRNLKMGRLVQPYFFYGILSSC